MPMCARRVPRRAGGMLMALPQRENVCEAREVNPIPGRAKPNRWRLTEMSNAVAVSDADFEQQIEKHDGLAVVDFWATWCGPCRMIAPILDQLAVEYEGKAKVAKLDVDTNQRTASKFKVRSIPTILFFKDGQLVDQVVGAVPKPKLEEVFRKHGG